MHDIMSVQVFDGVEGLAEELEGLCLVDGSMFILVSKQSPIFCEFQNHVDNLILQHGVPQFDDVGVVDAGVEVDLPL